MNIVSVKLSPLSSGLPTMIAESGDRAAWRFLEFFTVNIHARGDAGIEAAIVSHTFRAKGITDYLTNGGRIDVAQCMAGHSNAKTTCLYVRRNDDISVGKSSGSGFEVISVLRMQHC